MTIGNVKGTSGVFLPKMVAATGAVYQPPKADFSQMVDKLELSSKIEEAAQKKAVKGKKVISGIASAMFPGLGQAINGDVMKGISLYAGHISLAAAGIVLASMSVPVVPFVALGLLAAYDTAAIVDAVKTVK